MSHYKYLILLVTSVLHSHSTTTFTQTTIDLSNWAYIQLIDDNNVIDKVFFAPHDSVIIESLLIALIKSTRTSISGALFRLSNKKIIDALIEAHHRGVVIDIVLDPEAVTASKDISKLSHAGIPLALYNQKKYGTYMHHKFLIFSDTLACDKNNYVPEPAVVIYGSLNLTNNGFNGNRENINFRNRKEVVQAFVHEVEELKKGTDSYTLTNTESHRKPSVKHAEKIPHSKKSTRKKPESFLQELSDEFAKMRDFLM